jgi:hypothetical protein
VTALRDVSELLWPAVEETIADLGLGSSDAAAVKLARRYARVIDQATDAKQASVLRWLGPELLKVLAELGATPAARAAMTKGKKQPGDDKPNRLQQLRNARGA